MSFLFLFFLDKKLFSSLKPYVNTEVERFTSNIVHKAIRKKMGEQEDYHFLRKIEESGESYSYDTVQINSLKNEITDYVQEVLVHLDKADIDDFYLFSQLKRGKFKKIKNGILAENSLHSLQGSTLFGNIGPSVPVRLYFVGQVDSHIDIQVKEYGINNVIVEIYLDVLVKVQVIMPLSSEVKEISISELLSTDIIRGTVPSYYSGFSK